MMLSLVQSNERANDIHEGKSNGLDGKLETRETLEEWVAREVWKESGLTIQNPNYCGLLVFTNFNSNMKGRRCAGTAWCSTPRNFLLLRSEVKDKGQIFRSVVIYLIGKIYLLCPRACPHRFLGRFGDDDDSCHQVAGLLKIAQEEDHPQRQWHGNKGTRASQDEHPKEEG